MKATLEFDLSDLDEEMELRRMLKARDMAIALHSITQMMRDKCKYYDPDTNTNSTEDVLTVIRTEIIDILDSYSIDLDDIIM